MVSVLPFRQGGSDFGIFVPVIDSNLVLSNSRVASMQAGRLSWGGSRLAFWQLGT